MAEEEPSIFSMRLRAVREERGLSQSKLAGEAGLQPAAISHFETGQRTPSFANLRRLADALDESIDYLLGRTDQRRATGPRVDALFRHAQRLTAKDLQRLEKMAEIMSGDEGEGEGDDGQERRAEAEAEGGES